jgi:hypothetical protein
VSALLEYLSFGNVEDIQRLAPGIPQSSTLLDAKAELPHQNLVTEALFRSKSFTFTVFVPIVIMDKP